MGASEKVDATFHPGDGPAPRLDGEGNPAVQLGRWAFQLYLAPALVDDEPVLKRVLRVGIDRQKDSARLQGWWSSAQPGDATVMMEKAWAVESTDEHGEPTSMFVGYQTALLMRPEDRRPDPEGQPDMWAVWVHFPIAKLDDIETAAVVIAEETGATGAALGAEQAKARRQVIAGLEELALPPEPERTEQ